jgi:hypothetical protein
MTNKETLLNDIQQFCAQHSFSESGFGRWALNNANFVFDLRREDFSPKLSTVNRIEMKMKNYKTGERYHGDRS